MAMITISEEDFDAVAAGAWAARDAGNQAAAGQLDKIARKMNAALSRGVVSPTARSRGATALSWQDVPSVFETK